MQPITPVIVYVRYFFKTRFGPVPLYFNGVFLAPDTDWEEFPDTRVLH